MFREIDNLYIHIRNNRDFQKVYKYGKSLANRYLVMYVMKNDLSENRLGISVSKKVGNSVVRHRSYRLSCNKFEKGYDIVVIARITAKGRSYDDICSALIHLGKIHNIVSE